MRMSARLCPLPQLLCLVEASPWRQTTLTPTGDVLDATRSAFRCLRVGWRAILLPAGGSLPYNPAAATLGKHPEGVARRDSSKRIGSAARRASGGTWSRTPGLHAVRIA